MCKPSIGSNLVMFLALISCSALAETPASSGTGLEGVISVGPIHGGPTKQGIPNSKPLANTEFLAVATKDNTVVSFKTDDQGQFRTSLPPGHYTISRKDWNAKVGRYGPFEADVVAGQMTKVQWNCDSGMR